MRAPITQLVAALLSAVFIESAPVWAESIPSTADGSNARLDEVVVTAQKREERMQDVPIPVTSVSAETLIDRNQLRMQDYQNEVPGLRVTPSTGFGQVLAIRGITTGGAGGIPTVAITLDDVPLGSSTAVGLGLVVPDLDPNDLARVEVLRGPQGTLYGASSMGGLLKFVSKDPSTESASGRIEVGTSTVHKGDGPGYNVRASGNVPINDTLAIGLSGFTREDPGYIDNPVYGLDGVNSRRTSGGRVAALWRPLDVFSVKFSALYQHFDSDGTNAVQEGLGDLQQGWLPGSGRSSGQTQIYSAIVNGKIGSVDLVSVSGYNIRDARDGIDFSAEFGSNAQSTFQVGGANLVTSGRTKKFTEELRLTAPLGEHVELLLGGFYDHENSTYVQNSDAVNTSTGAAVGSGYYATGPTEYLERSIFADLTLRITNQFDVQVGGRWGGIEQQQLPGIFIAPFFGVTEPSIGTGTKIDFNPATYLLTPSFKFSDSLMVYARLASGYRAGGINGDPNDTNPTGCTALKLPCAFSPDKTHTYEVGVKGDFLDHTLSLDASAYHIDWSHLQLFVIASGFGFDTNASDAKSQGIELTAAMKPAAGTKIAIWGSWNDATLTKAFPAGATSYGLSGFRLPYSAKVSGSASVDHEFPIRSATGFVGATLSYVGDRPGLFAGSATDPRVDLPGYTQTDLRTGMSINDWQVKLTATNLFDKRGVLDRGGDITPAGSLYILPRTIGLSVSRVFGQ